MATQNSQAESSNKTLDMVIVTFSVLIVCAGVFGFTFLTDQSMGIRLLALLGSIVVAAVVASFSPSGKRFIAFCRESWDELRRVVWPTKKETVNTTGLVMGFVVLVSFYLFIVDKFIEWGLYDGLLRLTF